MLLYKLYKMVRTFKDGRTDKANNHWFARAIVIGDTTTDKLCEKIEEKCTLTKADIKACISAFITAIRDEIQDSKRVVLDGLGSFKIGINSVGAETVADFNVAQNITGAHVIFQPSYTREAGSGKKVVELLQGLKVRETPKNTVSKA